MNMNFDLSDLRAFIAVAELSSFRAAAETIHLSQPALSRRIDKLEDALGVRLFDRDTRNVELTAVGRDFARKSRSLLDDLDTILLGVRDVAANRWGQVTLACIPSTVHYFLPTVLRQYPPCGAPASSLFRPSASAQRRATSRKDARPPAIASGRVA